MYSAEARTKSKSTMLNKLPSLQLYAHEFVESAGAIVFNLQTKQVCLIYHRIKNEYFLPKGRRNCSESRIQAAIREVREETGWHCLLLPVTMPTRAPPRNEQGYSPDVAKVRETTSDPFALTIREEENGGRKLIWWYVAEVDESMKKDRASNVDSDFESLFVSYGEAVKLLSYEGDGKLVERAIELVHNTLIDI